jgi:hypothetical protein
MTTGARRNRNHPVRAFLDRLAGKPVVDHVVKGNPTP